MDTWISRWISARRVLLALGALSIAAGCTNSGAALSQDAPSPSPGSVTVQMKNGQGQDVATAVIFQGLPSELASSARMASSSRTSAPSAGGITVAIQVTDLPPGTHGFHVDSVGQCQAPDFNTVGLHLNPGNKSHGAKSRNGPHAGDLPNLTIDKDGTAIAAFFVGHLTMQQIAASPTGASLVVEANPDDDITDPGGNSGAHIACGVIRPGTAPSPTPAPTSNTAGMTNVMFTGLRMGTFPVHLHSMCNGSQSFHIAVMPNLVVDSNGQGSISVPSSDFGRGFCLIVYTSPSLSSVLTTMSV